MLVSSKSHHFLFSNPFLTTFTRLLTTTRRNILHLLPILPHNLHRHLRFQRWRTWPRLPSYWHRGPHIGRPLPHLGQNPAPCSNSPTPMVQIRRNASLASSLHRGTLFRHLPFLGWMDCKNRYSLDSPRPLRHSFWDWIPVSIHGVAQLPG